MNTFKGIWLPELSKDRQVAFEHACIEITQSDLQDFKRHKVYTGFIANDMRDEAVTLSFYLYLKNHYPELLAKYNEFKINDKVGSPNLYKFDQNLVSPGTLRFIKVLGDILLEFGSSKKIVEIGSGYGGQCLVCKTYDESIDYTLVDIVPSLLVADMYLAKQLIKHNSIPATEVQLKGMYDLCISDYCLSEFDQEGVQFYIDNVLKNCHSAYITTNSLGMPLKDFCKMLSQVYADISIMIENPKTSTHSNFILLCKGNNPII